MQRLKNTSTFIAHSLIDYQKEAFKIVFLAENLTHFIEF